MWKFPSLFVEQQLNESIYNLFNEYMKSSYVPRLHVRLDHLNFQPFPGQKTNTSTNNVEHVLFQNYNYNLLSLQSLQRDLVHQLHRYHPTKRIE